MKKKRLIIPLVLALLIAAGNLTAALVIRGENRTRAMALHGQIHGQYLQLLAHTEASTLTVTEQGQTVGVYTLDALGLGDPARAAAEAAFRETDRLTPEAFGRLSYDDQMAYFHEAPAGAAVSLSELQADWSAVLTDLAKADRAPAVDATLRYADGAYHIVPEIPGTETDTDAVTALLRQTLEAATVTPEQAAAVTVELTDTACYLPPAVTAEDSFDYAARLRQDLQGVILTVDFHGVTETLSPADVLFTNEDGAVQIDEDALSARISGWTEAHTAEHTAYVFDSYVDGPVEIPFLTVDYAVDAEGLESLLRKRLLTLQDASVAAPWFCTRDGEPFAIAGTYIAVDIQNQNMVYYKDGELILTTDVVTGYPKGHNTPRGFWAVQNRLPEQWLVGPDYRQFVRWWVGVNGPYGIHDASWRDVFGGELYLTDGSHGCINTPDWAMELLYDTVEVGTPVLFFG